MQAAANFTRCFTITPWMQVEANHWYQIYNYASPWLNGGPHAPPPPPPPPQWSSFSGTILFRGLSGITLAILPEKNWDSLLISVIFHNGCLKILRFPISPKLLHVGSWFGGSKPIFSWSRNQIYKAWQNVVMCIKDKKYVKKNPRWTPISYFISVNVS